MKFGRSNIKVMKRGAMGHLLGNFRLTVLYEGKRRYRMACILMHVLTLNMLEDKDRTTK